LTSTNVPAGGGQPLHPSTAMVGVNMHPNRRSSPSLIVAARSARADRTRRRGGAGRASALKLWVSNRTRLCVKGGGRPSASCGGAVTQAHHDARARQGLDQRRVAGGSVPEARVTRSMPVLQSRRSAARSAAGWSTAGKRCCYGRGGRAAGYGVARKALQVVSTADEQHGSAPGRVLGAGACPSTASGPGAGAPPAGPRRGQIAL